MYNNFSSKKTKKVISALLASALVVTSGPITADAATAKVVGIKKTFTVSASATNKVTGLSKAEKKVVKVTKKGKKFTIKGLKAGKATFKIGKKSYIVKVGATTVKAAKTKLTLTKGKKATLKFTTKSGNGDTLTFKASNKNVTLAKKSAKIAKSAASVKATAKKAGKTTITATSKATGKKATVTVTVKAATTPATATPGTSNTPSVTTGAATNTPEATATATATATASGSATNTPDVTATPVATATATPVATGSATNTPEATEVPTEAPTKAPEVVTGGTITVTTNVTGASIKVVSNGSVVAETTNTATSTAIKGIKAGTYTVEVSKDGYVTATKEVTVSGVDVTVNLDLEVKKLEVTSVVAVAGDKKVTLPATTVAANSQIEIYFNGDINSTSIVTGNITITKDGVKQLAKVTYNATKKAAILTLANNEIFEAGATYTINVNGVESADSLEMKAYTTTFTVAVAPIIKSATFMKDEVSDTYTDGQVIANRTQKSNGTLTDLDGSVIDGSHKLGDVDGDGNTDTSDKDFTVVDDEVITLTFNKEMNKSALTNDANIKVLDKTTGKYLQKTIGTPSADGKSVTVTIDKDALVSNGEYELTVVGMSSLDGTVMADQTFKFFYGITAPGLQNVVANNVAAANFGTDAVYGYLTAHAGYEGFSFKAQLTGDVNTATISNDTVTLVEKASGEVVKTTVRYEAGSRYIIITPSADLKEETEYQVTFDGIKTSAGLKVTKDDYTFTTGDFAAPSVVSVTPANGEDGVAVNKNIIITFSEGMDVDSLASNIKLKDLTDNNANTVNNNTEMQLSTYYAPALSQDGKTYTLTSVKDLEVGHSYQLTIKGNGFTAGVKDDASKGNYLTEDYVVKFATVNATTTYLTKVQADATGTYNKDFATVETNSTSFGTNKTIYFTFDKELEVSNNANDKITIEAKAVGATAWDKVKDGVALSSTDYDNSNKTIKVSPVSVAWANDTLYKISLTGLKDKYGNDVKDQTFSFTTGTKPSYKASNPAGFETGVALNNPYLFVAIEDAENDLNIGTLNTSTVKVVKKDDQSVAPYTFSKAQYASGIVEKDVTVGANTTFTVANANKYAAGDVLKFVGDNYVQYGIVDSKNVNARTVTLTDALANADANVTITKAIEAGTTVISANATEITVADSSIYSVGDLIRIEGSTTQYAVVTGHNTSTKITVCGTDNGKLKADTLNATTHKLYIFKAQGVVYSLNKDAKLAANTQYQFVLSGVKDAAGNEVDAVTKTFTTKADIKDLKFVSSSVKDNDAGVAVNQAITLTFNEDLDVSGTSNKALSDVIKIGDVTADPTTPADVTANFTISQDKGVVTITPKAFMKAGNVYRIKVDASKATSIYGTPEASLSEDKFINFQTETKASVTPKITSAKFVEGAASYKGTVIIKLNSAVTQTKANDLVAGTNVGFFVDGAVAATPCDSVTVLNDGYTIAATFVTNTLPTSFVAGASKIAIADANANTVTLVDLFGTSFSSDAVVVEK